MLLIVLFCSDVFLSELYRTGVIRAAWYRLCLGSYLSYLLMLLIKCTFVDCTPRQVGPILTPLCVSLLDLAGFFNGYIIFVFTWC